MTGLVAGAIIVIWTALRAGPALLALTGRERNPVFDIAWPLSLWILALLVVFVLVPHSPLVAEASAERALAGTATGVSLVCVVPLARLGWRFWRTRQAAAG
jgi:hypothetical protein